MANDFGGTCVATLLDREEQFAARRLSNNVAYVVVDNPSLIADDFEPPFAEAHQTDWSTQLRFSARRR
jgi:hypothetical protein